jgi:hypothetical protein
VDLCGLLSTSSAVSSGSGAHMWFWTQETTEIHLQSTGLGGIVRGHAWVSHFLWPTPRWGQGPALWTRGVPTRVAATCQGSAGAGIGPYSSSEKSRGVLATGSLLALVTNLRRAARVPIPCRTPDRCLAAREKECSSSVTMNLGPPWRIHFLARGAGS